MKAIVTGNSLALVGGFRHDNSCASLTVILSVVVSPLHVVHFTNIGEVWLASVEFIASG